MWVGVCVGRCVCGSVRLYMKIVIYVCAREGTCSRWIHSMSTYVRAYVRSTTYVWMAAGLPIRTDMKLISVSRTWVFTKPRRSGKKFGFTESEPSEGSPDDEAAPSSS